MPRSEAITASWISEAGRSIPVTRYFCRSTIPTDEFSMMLENTTVFGTMMRSPAAVRNVVKRTPTSSTRPSDCADTNAVSNPEGSLDENVDPVDESAADILKGEADAEGGSTEDGGDGGPTGANNRQDHGCANGIDGESGRPAQQGRDLGVDSPCDCGSPNPTAGPVRDSNRKQNHDKDLNCLGHGLRGLGFVQPQRRPDLSQNVATSTIQFLRNLSCGRGL